MLEMRMWLLLQECKKAGIPVGSTRGEGVSEQGIDELARKLTLRWLKDNPVHVLRQGAYWKTGTCILNLRCNEFAHLNAQDKIQIRCA